MAVLVPLPPLSASRPERLVPLGSAGRGFRGVIRAVDASAVASSLPADELERRLLELGMVEGATVEVLHQGPIGRDPIAVRVNGEATFALRRREAAAVLVAIEDMAAEHKAAP